MRVDLIFNFSLKQIVLFIIMAATIGVMVNLPNKWTEYRAKKAILSMLEEAENAH